jgi:predicted transcriptional regulator
MSRQESTVYSQLVDTYLSNDRKKRTELGQLIQVLEYLLSSGDIIISSIARYTNMSHCRATKICEKLVNADLISREVTYNNKRYRITSEGISFLKDCKDFRDILCRYRLPDALYY